MVFAPIRKPGKLPREVISADYEKYGVDTPHTQMLSNQANVIIVDTLATGGTKATIEMIENSVASLQGSAFLIELMN